MNALPNGIDFDLTQIQQPIKVKKVCTHKSPHLDEIVALWLIRRYGAQTFTGIENAPVEFSAGLPTRTDSECDTEGTVLIGLGGGRFDEHRGSKGRIPNTCSAKLVAQYLGVSQRPELVPLLQRVNYGDNNTGVKSSELAELVKVGHRRLRNNGDMLVVRWVFTALDAIVNSFGKAPSENGATLAEMIRTHVKLGHYETNGRVTQRLYVIAHDSAKHVDVPTELAAIIQDMQALKMSSDDIDEWLRFALDAIYADQTDFLAEADRSKEHVRCYPIQGFAGGSTIELSLAVYYSDSPLSLKAVRYWEEFRGIILIRQSDGHTQIFIDRQTRMAARTAVAMLRWLELSDDLRDEVPWEILEMPGNLVWNGVEYNQWYYHSAPTAENIFNGSLTHPGVTPTDIPVERIIFALEHAFHGRKIRAWRKHYGM